MSTVSGRGSCTSSDRSRIGSSADQRPGGATLSSGMEGVRVGRSGLQVSRLCLGTMIFGSQRDQSEAFAIMNMATELGIDFIDVADVYPVPPLPETWGRTEEIVGAWLQGKRERFVVATKCVNRVGPGRNDSGGSRKHVIEACEASLRRLKTDRVDLYYVHRSDLDTRTSTRPWRRRSRPSTALCRTARSFTSASRTLRPGRWRWRCRRSRSPTWHASPFCSLATICSTDRTSAISYGWRGPRAWASCPTTRSAPDC